MDRLATQGIDLVSMMQIKIGNGVEYVFLGGSLDGEKSLKEAYPRLYALEEVPIKVNIHAWKVSLDGLPTRWNISRRVVKDIFRKICNW
uniref:Uncharacterized protein n=1 Tax=Tanacetum cinerariifolium TaxID=118510 RepID=A0A699U682_TANCI|nr:hypothetical protein [Tanacetum cinerariifolium]